MWDLSCRDWKDRLMSGRSLMPRLPLDRKAADRAVAIFNKLRLPDVKDSPALLDAGAPWFRDIVAAIFGSMVGGKRMVRETFCMVPKKSSKTTNGAGALVTALVLNQRPRAEFLFVGPTHEISDLAFAQAAGMVDLDPYLCKRFKVRDHLKQIDDLLTQAKLKIKTFDTKVMTGVKPVGVMVDELHEISDQHDADKVIGQIRGGLISQPEGFLLFVTTQSDEPPEGVFKAELMKARAIRDGRVSGSMLPILYEFPEEILTSDRWRDERLWNLVNPNAGKSIEISRLVEDYHGALLAGEGEMRRWASQHLNIEIGLALQSDTWAGAPLWIGRSQPNLSLQTILDTSEVVTVGIDGGGLDDLLGLCVLGRHAETKHWQAWFRAWCHPMVLERRMDVAPKLKDLAEAGELTLCKRMGDDVEEVCDIVDEVDRANLLPPKNAIGVDTYGIGQIVDELDRRQVDTGKIVGIPQGYRLNGAIKTLERKLADGTFSHDGSALMNWCVGNAKVEARGNAIVITKQAAGSAKIDPLMAGLDAVALMSLNPEARFAGAALLRAPLVSYPENLGLAP